MKVHPDVVKALCDGKRVRVRMPEADTLEDGKKLVNAFAACVPFQLVYLQVLGDNPQVIVWRKTGKDMERYHAGHTDA